MRHDKLSQQLDLILLLAENRRFNINELGEQLGLQRRNIYYYLNFLREAGFLLEKHGAYYSLSRRSPFISKLCDTVNFTEDEVVLIKRLLDEADEKDILVHSLKHKLLRFYDFNIIADPIRMASQKKKIDTIYEAIKHERTVILKGYSSSHSQTVSDREVEPFLLFDGNRNLRAYELSTGMNKTFRISRMEDVVPGYNTWSNTARHKQFYTDTFGFSSEEQIHVTLRLDRLSFNTLTDEYPRAERDIAADGTQNWIYSTGVCSMVGIGRFVLGLYDHVEIVDSPELERYIKEKLKDFTQKNKASRHTKA